MVKPSWLRYCRVTKLWLPGFNRNALPNSEFDPAQCGWPAPAIACSPSDIKESAMTLDTIMVIIAVTAMFATLAFVLGWADRYTNSQPKN
jgi:hypothetical protein